MYDSGVRYEFRLRLIFQNINAIIYAIKFNGYFMGFIRCLNDRQISALYDIKNIELYNRLKKDILSGEVFPAVRKNQLYFYYKGGCLYKFSNGKFTRDKKYIKYTSEAADLTEYEVAKRQNENKFTNARGNNKERQLLDSLCRYTFGSENTDTIVLDIEVNLNGTVGRGKKCDLVLYNLKSKELMFVEGKVFSDSRVNVKSGCTPEVIGQVNTYTEAIDEQEETIIKQYGNHVNIINSLFGTAYEVPFAVVKPAKLLVYETPPKPTDNNRYSIESVNSAIGTKNVVWFNQGERPSINEIWDKLCK